MSTRIPVPELGEGITEVTIIGWLTTAGDTVKEGDPIAAVETDKASMEIESPVSGRVTALLVEAGDSPEIGDPIALIEPE